MSGVQNLYPSTPKASADAETFRLQVINNIQNDLTAFMDQDRSSATRVRKKLEKIQSAVAWLGSIGTAVSLAGGTVGATGVGIIPGGVLIGGGVAFGTASVIASKMEKRVMEKLIKFDKMASLGESKLLSLREKISKAIDDESVSQEELQFINDEMRKFSKQRSDILNEEKKLVRSKNRGSKRWSRMGELEEQLAKEISNFMKRKSGLAT